MPDITTIKIGNERERSYKDFPANREFKKRAEDDNPGGGWPADLPKPSVGGYGYTDEDDTVHKIDEKYLPEVGGDPVVENAKETGGIGWTESGDQTVITWDGDTSGKTFVVNDDGDIYCKVSDKMSNPSDYIGGKVNNTADGDIEITDEMVIPLSGATVLVDGCAIVVTEAPFSDSGFTFSETGLYFQKWNDGDYVKSLTYGTPDTVHKIDEKYLPEAGGSTLFYVDDTNTDGYLDDNTLYLDEDRTIEATLEDIKASVGTVVQLIATSGKIYTPVECMTRSNEYGFIVIQVNSSDGTQKALFFTKIKLS